ncbi:chaplin [Streptomyces sp. NBC_00354]|uniref:chaplin n=1 Tax=Streptomyces sp. NBC_00354 TaxID=2975723 RepID=UPI0022518300|nr:chaplin [Streptomyces sp. NBC_01001]
MRGATMAVASAAVLTAGAGLASADSAAEGVAAGSPGVLSGNLLQVPVDVPVNVCGNTVNIIALLNPAFGNHCVNA